MGAVQVPNLFLTNEPSCATESTTLDAVGDQRVLEDQLRRAWRGEWTSEDGAGASTAAPQGSDQPVHTKPTGRLRPSARQSNTTPTQAQGPSYVPPRPPPAGNALPTALAAQTQREAATGSGPQATPQLNLGGLPIADLLAVGAFLAEASDKAGPAAALAIRYLLYRAGLNSTPIDPASLRGVTFHYGDGGTASSTLFEPTKAFPSSGEGDYQPPPGVPAPPTPELRLLDQLASEADKSVAVSLSTPFGDLPIPAWLRGIFVHAQFARLVSAEFGADHAEASYSLGDPVRYGYPGSVRADAIVGPVNAPTIAVDLKTAGAFLTTGQIREYYRNLPEGVLVVEIKLVP